MAILGPYRPLPLRELDARRLFLLLSDITKMLIARCLGAMIYLVSNTCALQSVFFPSKVLVLSMGQASLQHFLSFVDIAHNTIAPLKFVWANYLKCKPERVQMMNKVFIMNPRCQLLLGMDSVIGFWRHCSITHGRVT